MEKRFQSMAPTADLPQLLALFAARRPQEGQEGKGWYRIVNVSQSEAEVFIYDEIGFWGVTAGDFINELRDIKASKITLRINSPGGDVFDGIAIYNAISRHPAFVDVFIDGIAASAASFIAMAGDTVTMSPHSQMMIHEAAGLVIGPADDMRKMADILDKSSDNIAAIYAGRAGGAVEDWRAAMKAETWFSDQEAVDAGLADGIDGVDAEDMPEKMPKKMANTIGPEDPKPEPEPEPEPEPQPEPVDFKKLTEQIIEEAEESLYAPA
jgi:ATP-dependent protease ClpP protease subunit